MKPSTLKTWSRELATFFVLWLLAVATYGIVTGTPDTVVAIINTLAFPLLATWAAVFGIDKAIRQGGWIGGKPDPPGSNEEGAQP